MVHWIAKNWLREYFRNSELFISFETGFLPFHRQFLSNFSPDSFRFLSDKALILVTFQFMSKFLPLPVNFKLLNRWLGSKMSLHFTSYTEIIKVNLKIGIPLALDSTTQPPDGKPWSVPEVKSLFSGILFQRSGTSGKYYTPPIHHHYLHCIGRVNQDLNKIFQSS